MVNRNVVTAPSAETFAELQDDVRHDLTHQHRRKIPALTGIRGVAAMWVVCLHGSFFAYSLNLPFFQQKIPVIRSGHLGVDLFFMLSGFVLMLTYGESVSNGWSGVRDFAVGRAFRILPLHWAVLLLFVAVSPFIGEGWITVEPHDLKNLLIAGSLLQSAVHHSSVWNTPAWSLSAEWICYFLFPVMALAITRIHSRSILIFSIVMPLALLVGVILAHHSPVTLNQIDRVGIGRCATEMIAGIALCRLCRLAPPSRNTGNIMMISGLSLLVVAMFGSVAEFACLPAFALLIAACYSPSPFASSLFGNRMVHWLGEISFSIYILHWLLFEITVRAARLVGGSDEAFFVAMAVPLVAVLPLAWLLRRWVEVPGQAAGRVVLARLRARDAARAAQGSAVTSSAR